jgi:hypothetical protein
METRHTPQNVVSPAANTDISTMDGYLAEVRGQRDRNNNTNKGGEVT